VLGVFSPFLKTGSSLQTKVSAFTTGLKNLQELEEDNHRLQVENNELKARNQLLSDLHEENARLRNALGYRERSVFQLVPARVVARDSSTWWNTIKIDRGFNDGVEPEMPVVTELGLVGKTTTVAGNMATVLLVSDESCRVAVSVEGTRHQGIASGERVHSAQAPLLSLTFLDKDANLQPGKRVFTSGVGEVFPSGVLVGTVKDFTPRELDGKASLIPAVDLYRLSDVFVVVGRKPQ
jgi:rod shape-determining protein MreC